MKTKDYDYKILGKCEDDCDGGIGCWSAAGVSLKKQCVKCLCSSCTHGKCEGKHKVKMGYAV